MNKEEIFRLINENPAFHLATVEDDQPRVRGMFLFSADEDGIIFHTANTKDIYGQIMSNPKAELCFNSSTTQVRVSGMLEEVKDEELKNKIVNHPTRKFLKAWESMGILDKLSIFRLKNGVAVTWTMETNFVPKELIQL